MSQASSAPVRIRPALASDVDALLALENASFSGDRISTRRMKHWVTAKNAILLVAIRNGELIASCLGLTRADSAALRLYSLAVGKAARGQGLGAKLLRKVEAMARERGCESVRLEVAAGNAAAIGLYQKLGYQVFGRKQRYYDDGQDALRMRKALLARNS